MTDIQSSEPEKPESSEESQAKAFALKHQARIKMWLKSHGNIDNLPIIVIPGEEPKWMNRAERRKMKRR